MNRAIVVGLSVLSAATSACGGKSQPAATATDTQAPVPSNGIPLVQEMGWVDGSSNAAGIAGAVFSFADDTTKNGLTEDFTQPGKACIKGTAAKVDDRCTPPKGVTDCFALTFGADIGENLNQTPAPDGGPDSPRPFDASAFSGFFFDVDGPTVPTSGSFRFSVVDAQGTNYGSRPGHSILKGANTMLFTDLLSDPFHGTGSTADTAKTGLVRITWQVVSNDTSAVPFDFCVSNVAALPR